MTVTFSDKVKAALVAVAEVDVEVWTPLIVAVVEREGEPAAVAIGWQETLTDGTRAAVVESVIIRPKFRGRESGVLITEVRDAWDAECRAAGLTTMVTRIEKSRPALVRIGARYAGYIPYTEDAEFIWCHRPIPPGA